MTEMTGTVADLRQNDYVDEIGGLNPDSGITYRRNTVGALVHSITQRDATYDEEMAWRLSGLPGISVRTADRIASRPQHATINFLGRGDVALLAEAPVKFRRKDEAVAAATGERHTWRCPDSSQRINIEISFSAAARRNR
jgi:hypothetical protein